MESHKSHVPVTTNQSSNLTRVPPRSNLRFLMLMLLPTTIQHASDGDAFQAKADQRTFAPQYPAIPTSIRYNHDHGKTVSSTIYPPLYLKIDMQTPSKSTSSRSFPRESHGFPEPKWSLWKVEQPQCQGPMQWSKAHDLLESMKILAGRQRCQQGPESLVIAIDIAAGGEIILRNPSTSMGVWGTCSLGMTNKIYDSCMDNNDNRPNKIWIWIYIYIYNTYIYIYG